MVKRKASKGRKPVEGVSRIEGLVEEDEASIAAAKNQREKIKHTWKELKKKKLRDADGITSSSLKAKIAGIKEQMIQNKGWQYESPTPSPFLVSSGIMSLMSPARAPAVTRISNNSALDSINQSSKKFREKLKEKEEGWKRLLQSDIQTSSLPKVEVTDRKEVATTNTSLTLVSGSNVQITDFSKVEVTASKAKKPLLVERRKAMPVSPVKPLKKASAPPTNNFDGSQFQSFVKTSPVSNIYASPPHYTEVRRVAPQKVLMLPEGMSWRERSVSPVRTGAVARSKEELFASPKVLPSRPALNLPVSPVTGVCRVLAPVFIARTNII